MDSKEINVDNDEIFNYSFNSPVPIFYFSMKDNIIVLNKFEKGKNR
jgi:hypothetical protein